jgi:hypothetical protein
MRTGESGNASTSPPPATAPHANTNTNAHANAYLTESAIIPKGFSEHAVQSPVVYLPSGQIYTGGAATDGDEHGECFVPPTAVGVPIGVATATATATATPISLKTLFAEMKNSVADLEIVRGHVADPAWASIFQTMSPTDFGRVIQHVDLAFDQPKIASVLAAKIPNVTCQYVVAAVRAASDWNRSTMVERLVPLVTDLVANQHIILAQLSDWDKVVTERVFQQALAV